MSIVLQKHIEGRVRDVHALVAGRYDAAGGRAFGDGHAPLVHGESVTVL